MFSSFSCQRQPLGRHSPVNGKTQFPLPLEAVLHLVTSSIMCIYSQDCLSPSALSAEQICMWNNGMNRWYLFRFFSFRQDEVLLSPPLYQRVMYMCQVLGCTEYCQNDSCTVFQQELLTSTSVELEVHKGESKAYQYLSAADLENLRNASSQEGCTPNLTWRNKHEVTCVAV